jgi:DNA-binding transcriptional MerR regulator
VAWTVTEGHTIGEVLNLLRQDFADVSISKIRFLESEGLIRPGRSESGYRQFSTEDIERLRYILTAQRDRYLPLRVIKEELSRVDAGLPPEPETSARPQTHRRVDASDDAALLSDVVLDRTELAHASGLGVEDVDALVTHGLLDGTGPFDGVALRTARLAAELLRRGLEPRHLRAYRLAADREIDRIEQLVLPMLRQRNPESRRRRGATAEELVALGAQLHRLLVEARLDDTLRS